MFYLKKNRLEDFIGLEGLGADWQQTGAGGNPFDDPPRVTKVTPKTVQVEQVLKRQDQILETATAIIPSGSTKSTMLSALTELGFKPNPANLSRVDLAEAMINEAAKVAPILLRNPNGITADSDSGLTSDNKMSSAQQRDYEVANAFVSKIMRMALSAGGGGGDGGSTEIAATMKSGILGNMDGFVPAGTRFQSAALVAQTLLGPIREKLAFAVGAMETAVAAKRYGQGFTTAGSQIAGGIKIDASLVSKLSAQWNNFSGVNAAIPQAVKSVVASAAAQLNNALDVKKQHGAAEQFTYSQINKAVGGIANPVAGFFVGLYAKFKVSGLFAGAHTTQQEFRKAQVEEANRKRKERNDMARVRREDAKAINDARRKSEKGAQEAQKRYDAEVAKQDKMWAKIDLAKEFDNWGDGQKDGKFGSNAWGSQPENQWNSGPSISPPPGFNPTLPQGSTGPAGSQGWSGPSGIQSNFNSVFSSPGPEQHPEQGGQQPSYQTPVYQQPSQPLVMNLPVPNYGNSANFNNNQIPTGSGGIEAGGPSGGAFYNPPSDFQITSPFVSMFGLEGGLSGLAGNLGGSMYYLGATKKNKVKKPKTPPLPPVVINQMPENRPNWMMIGGIGLAGILLGTLFFKNK